MAFNVSTFGFFQLMSGNCGFRCIGKRQLFNDIIEYSHKNSLSSQHDYCDTKNPVDLGLFKVRSKECKLDSVTQWRRVRNVVGLLKFNT